MRATEYFFIVVGAVLWGLAFFYGPLAGTWVLGKVGIFFFGLSALLRVIEFLIPNKKPKPKRAKGPVRKCPACGKPATAGSNYCSYHTRYGPEEGRR